MHIPICLSLSLADLSAWSIYPSRPSDHGPIGAHKICKGSHDNDRGPKKHVKNDRGPFQLIAKIINAALTKHFCPVVHVKNSKPISGNITTMHKYLFY